MTRKKRHEQDPPPPAADPQGPDAPPARPEPPAPAPDETQALRAERDDLLSRLQRLSADYLNYQKRAQRDLDQARQFANEELIRNLLGVLDDMERALEHARANHGQDDPLYQGMQLVHDKALETLGRFGLEPIRAIGEPFDPEHHAAMMQEPSTEQPPCTVLRELQRGYRLNGRTLRPAAVVVAAASASEEGGAASPQGGPAPAPGEQPPPAAGAAEGSPTH